MAKHPVSISNVEPVSAACTCRQCSYFDRTRIMSLH